MQINNLNYDKIEYKGNKLEKQLTMNEIVNQFYRKVRQQMPIDGDFDDISMNIQNDEKGEYYLGVETFKDINNSKNINNLNISYIPYDKDFKINMRILKGSKQDILDYLGNENNISEIKSLMSDLRRQAIAK